MECPSQKTIEAFLSGELGYDSLADVELHFGSCTDCQKLLEELSAAHPLVLANTDHQILGWSENIADRLISRLEQSDSGNDLEAELSLPVMIGDYELLELIGRGGMGSVYRARQVKLNRTVAVKVILRQFFKPSQINRFQVEVSSAAKLDHPGIVPIFDVGQSGPYLFYSMALMPGGTLADRLKRGAISSHEAVTLVKEIAWAISYAHEHGVIHRDLKPANILLEQDGIPRIADFGLAKQVESGAELTATGEILGTPAYMPPEQATGESDVTTASDIYGLGAILYHALTGQAPFKGQDPVQVLYQVIHYEPASIRKIVPGLSLDLETITRKCMAKQPQDRMSSAAEVARELERYLKGEPIHSRPVNSFIRLQRWCSRHPALALLTSTTIVTLILGSVISIYFGLLANHRYTRLSETNIQLEDAERKATKSASDAQLQAEMATKQANIALQALESTLYDLQRVVMNDPAQQEQRRHLLQSVLNGLESLNTDVVSPDRLRRCRATANLGLAEVAVQLGDERGRTGATAAIPLYEKSIAEFQAIYEHNPENMAVVHDLIEALSSYGNMLVEAGQWKKAHESFLRALPICEKLCAAQPDQPVAQGSLLQLKTFDGECLIKTGQPEQAEMKLVQARTLGLRLLDQFPDDTFVRVEYVYALQVLGDSFMQQKKYTVAEECFQEMKSHMLQLVAQYPQSSEFLMRLSTALERLGMLRVRQGNISESLDQHLESLSLAEASAKYAPNNEKVQWELSFGYQHVADCYLRLGKNGEARDYASQCIEIRQRLANRDHENSQLHAKLLHDLKTLAIACERQQDVDAAIQAYRQIVQVSKEFKRHTGEDRFQKANRAAYTNCERLSKETSKKKGP
ncbi:Serine/threonine-protein kinase PknB [Gimesia alba]|uniref:non-specific serine/threonine protein kinase n=1 Tax=Gimesia alba TaxID=2527973 RepID=A0A517RGK4_9PLAN|nr:serine/threonine-protein kinase [Gimesia alba]QDT43006.1 Serine/threonine-protein kinase PknB [Gimesia alba]